MSKNIKDFNLEELKKEFEKINEKPYRAGQVYEWIYQKRVNSFDDMTNISLDLRNKLKENFHLGLFQIVKKLVSKDGTKKYLFDINDEKGSLIETVLMQYHHGYTVCVSSEIGCPMGCTFCASTGIKFDRGLTPGEIVEQIMAIEREENVIVSNIVFMGIGEPFDNYGNVMKAIGILNDPKALNIGARHISVSTSGIVPKIYQFADEKYQCTLSISLHSANNETRSSMMPVNKAYPIEELMKACKYYIEKTNKRISFEYALAKDNNDNLEAAKELVNLLHGMLCHVNLIPINKIDNGKYIKSSNENIIKFRDYLNSKGIVATIRRELGSDIEAACRTIKKTEFGGEMRILAKSDVGKARDMNQDSFYVSDLEKDDVKLYILADGMGGYKGGEVASGLAVTCVKNYITNNFSKISKEKDEILNLINSAIEYANMVVYEKSQEIDELKDMGTTIDVVILYNNKVFIGHVGDSRVYRVRKNIIRKLTQDHSYVEKLVRDGSITKEEAFNHPNKNMLLKAVGCNNLVKPDVFYKGFLKGDILLMCSDGLTNMLKESEIYNILLNNPEKPVEALINSANKAGGLDNITAIIVDNV